MHYIFPRKQDMKINIFNLQIIVFRKSLYLNHLHKIEYHGICLFQKASVAPDVLTSMALVHVFRVTLFCSV